MEKPSLKSSYFSLLPFVLLFLMMVTSSTRTRQCNISRDLVYGGVLVDCSNCHLSQYDLKELIFENATTLLISYNNLGILPNNSLSRFDLLRRLECTGCGLVKLEQDALRGLSNLEILRVDQNHLKLVEHAFPKGVFTHVPHLKTLDIQDSDNQGPVYNYSHYIDIFDSLQELTDLSIDSFDNLRIGEEFTKLTNLDRLRINCANLKSISNDSLNGFQHSNLSRFQLLGRGAPIPRSQIGFEVFHFLPSVSFLGIDYLRVGNHNVMRLMKPLAGRSIRTIAFNATFSSPYSNFEQKVEDGIVTVEVSKYLGEICVEEFLWYNSRVITIETDAPLTPTWQHCLVGIVLETDAIILNADSTIFFKTFLMKKLQRVSHLVTGHKLIKHFWQHRQRNHDTADQIRETFLYTHSYDDVTDSDQIINPSFKSTEYRAFMSSQFNSDVSVNEENEYTPRGEIYNLSRMHSNDRQSSSKAKYRNHYKHSDRPGPDRLDTPTPSLTSNNSEANQLIITFPPELKSMEIDGNHLVSFDRAFRVRENNVSSFSITNCYGWLKFTKNIYGLDNLETIDLQGSRLSVFPVFFRMFPSLNKLILRRTQYSSKYIQTSCKEIVENVPALEYLDIAENELHRLPSGTFHNNKNLKYLCLASNRFSTLPFNLKLTPNLQLLDLRENSFVEISAKDRADIDDHIARVYNFTILLDNNQLSCSCSVFSFIAWLQDHTVHFDHSGNYSCLSEDGTISYTASYKDILGFWRKCQGRDHFLISLIMACALMAGYLAIFLGMKNRTQIVSKVMQMVNPGFRLKTRQDFTYDVCIGYASQEGLYIKDVLLRYLEGKWHLRTFVHQRDLLQDPLLMSHAVRDSWRCLLVITDNFLYHYDMAHNVMKVASFFVTPSNPRSVVVLVVEEVQHQIPDYILQVVDEDNIITIPNLHGPLDYEAKEALKTRLTLMQ